MALTKNELKKIYLSISIVVVIICIIGILIITKGNKDEPDVEAAEELPTKVKKENIKKPKKTTDDKPKNTFVPPVIPEKPVIPSVPVIPAGTVANVPLDNEKCVEKITENFVEATGHVANIVKNGVQQFKTNCADLLDKDEGKRRVPVLGILAAGLAVAYASSYFICAPLTTVATMAGYLAFSK